jgi:sensor histidine kinase YesM
VRCRANLVNLGMQEPSIPSRWLDHFFDRRILLHVLYWSAVVGFSTLVFHRDFQTYLDALVNALVFLPGHIIFTYSTIYFLLPAFIFPGKVFGSIAWFIVILGVSLLYLKIADIYLLRYSGRDTLWELQSMPRSLAALFAMGGVAVSIKLIRTWYREKEVQRQLEKEKLEAELNLLKAQVQPHFLFNTLNNIYALTMERSIQAPSAVLRLSSLLRYILYECNETESSLTKEIGVLKDYIELEQMRYGERLDINFRFSGDIGDKQIAPLLLLPFIENSFKHGTGEQLDQCWVMLDLYVEGDELKFKLSNSRGGLKDDNATPEGIGLGHVRKRLDLLYPGRHSLRIMSDADSYTVSLVVLLNRVNEPVFNQSIIGHEVKMSIGR